MVYSFPLIYLGLVAVDLNMHYCILKLENQYVYHQEDGLQIKRQWKSGFIRAVFHDEDRILPISVLLDGQYGQHDVYASVPARLNREGVADIIELNLTEEEQKEFAASCKTMDENYRLALTL